MAHPPTSKWQLAPRMKYCCFLSHYKAETGGTARYLKDSLDQMLGCPSFLDSSNLVDLRQLFYGGVHKSEVLLVLLSPGVSTSPHGLTMATDSPEDARKAATPHWPRLPRNALRKTQRAPPSPSPSRGSTTTAQSSCANG